ncbi:SDR family oxidoreductase [Agromyces salentinus]|uniref:SDR family oxidoreductase n=1 Tax=Agromyces salentinus TaxID=269421 RepID=UPI0031B643B6
MAAPGEPTAPGEPAAHAAAALRDGDAERAVEPVRLAVVTGASRGIGRAIASRLARGGADIVGVGSSIDGLADAAAEVEALGRRFEPLAADLADPDAALDLASRITAAFGTPDVLVQAAGINRRAPAAEHPTADWDDVLGVNLRSPFILARELGRGMLARGSGKVVFVASLLSFQGGLTVPGYAASKGGIAQLTKALANEWAARGVNVNAVAPGYVATDMNEALQADPVRFRQISERIPAGRWATPDDIAGAVAFLASPDAVYVHGVVLPVDGGWLGR